MNEREKVKVFSRGHYKEDGTMSKADDTRGRLELDALV